MVIHSLKKVKHKAGCQKYLKFNFKFNFELNWFCIVIMYIVHCTLYYAVRKWLVASIWMLDATFTIHSTCTLAFNLNINSCIARKRLFRVSISLFHSVHSQHHHHRHQYHHMNVPLKYRLVRFLSFRPQNWWLTEFRQSDCWVRLPLLLAVYPVQ